MMLAMTLNGNGHKHWKLQKEKILVYSGLALIGAAFVLWAVFQIYQREFLLAGLALCGIGITAWGDKKDR